MWKPKTKQQPQANEYNNMIIEESNQNDNNMANSTMIQICKQRVAVRCRKIQLISLLHMKITTLRSIQKERKLYSPVAQEVYDF